MKKIVKIGMIFVITICLLLSFGLPVGVLGNDHVKITEGFTLVDGENGQRIPIGATIRHFDNGETKVYNSNNSLVLTTSDSDSDMAMTPEGPMKANHIYGVPSGTHVDHMGNTLIFSDDNNKVFLTVIDRPSMKREQINTALNTIIPNTGGWNEDAERGGLKFNLFSAYWDCPSSPPDNHSYISNFLFTGIEPPDGSSIIQPVLQWNQGGSPGWTGSAWYVYNGGSAHSTFISVSVGDTIYGEMYNNSSNNYWNIEFYDNDTYGSTALYVNTNIPHDPSAGNRAFVALETYNGNNGNIDNNDVPGDTTFSSLHLTHSSVEVSFSWTKFINTAPVFQCTNRDVTWTGTSIVNLLTNN
jgi:hypothetical protein